MRIGRNLAAALLSSVWTAALGFATVPIYLRYLGVDAYGLIGFFVTIQSLLQLLDLGLAPSVNREVARGFPTGALTEVRVLVRTLARLYWLVAAAIALVICCASALISDYWIHSERLSAHSVRTAVAVMGIVIGARWPLGLYIAVINGAQRVASSSAVAMLVATLSNVGAVLALALIGKRIEVYFLWQLCVALLNVSLMRLVAWRVLGTGIDKRTDWRALAGIWKFSAGMSAIAVLGAIFTQMDKVLLSKLLSLAAFGEYMLAATVAGALSLLVVPVFNVIFPRFSALVAAQQPRELLRTYRIAMRSFGTIFFTIALVLASLSAEVVSLWTQNPGISADVAPLVSLLVIGSALNGAMTIPHALQLACGLTRIPLTVNLLLLAIMGPTIIALVYAYGGNGGALAWLLLNLLYVVLSLWLTYRAVLRPLGEGTLLADLLVPLSYAIFAGASAYGLHRSALLGAAFKIASGAVIGMLTIAMGILSFPPARAATLQMARWNQPRTT